MAYSKVRRILIHPSPSTHLHPPRHAELPPQCPAVSGTTYPKVPRGTKLRNRRPNTSLARRISILPDTLNNSQPPLFLLRKTRPKAPQRAILPDHRHGRLPRRLARSILSWYGAMRRTSPATPPLHHKPHPKVPRRAIHSTSTHGRPKSSTHLSLALYSKPSTSDFPNLHIHLIRGNTVQRIHGTQCSILEDGTPRMFDVAERWTMCRMSRRRGPDKWTTCPEKLLGGFCQEIPVRENASYAT
jgi:hypothetical protein